MATTYDPSIIQRFADRLYHQADRIVYVYAIGGFVIGAAAGVALSASFNDTTTTFIGAIGAGALSTLLFASAGYSRGFTLRLQAQTALCQVQIESNSRQA